tara:strand:+ start:2438 stop:2809 length:372 start_codon:yes stop_codon:yes gene_type:complete
MILLLAKFLNCGEKTDRNGKIIGNYGIAQDNTHRPHELVPVFYFRFRWVQKVMFKLLDKSYPILFTTFISYNDRVWDRWRRYHNFQYFFHYKYDRPYGMGIHAKIPYRWTYKNKFADKVSYID